VKRGRHGQNIWETRGFNEWEMMEHDGKMLGKDHLTMNDDEK
jgi:hypothetical protein